MSSTVDDIWGDIYRDHYEGRIHPHVYERDDGRLDHVDSAAASFVAPRSDAERRYLDALAGPVLDVGAGAGSDAMYLQSRDLEVTAIDASLGAIDVCRRRGCRDARAMDLRALELPQRALSVGDRDGQHPRHPPDTGDAAAASAWARDRMPPGRAIVLCDNRPARHD